MPGREPRATTAQGAIVHGRVLGEAAHDLRWLAADGGALPLTAIQRIDFAPAAALAPAGGPLRQITLRGGANITGVLVGLDDRQARFVLRAVGPIALPRSAVTVVGALPGLRDVIYEDFEAGTLQFVARAGQPELARGGDGLGTRTLVLGRPIRLASRLDAPLKSGRVQLRFRQSAKPSAPAACECGLELEFAAATRVGPRVLRIVLDARSGRPEIVPQHSVGLTVQRVPARDGWRRLTVLFREERLVVLVDEHVLASGPAASGGLMRLQLFCDLAGAAGGPAEVRAGDEPTELLVDDVLVQEFVTAVRQPARHLGSDVVAFNAGDRLFGTVTAADSHSVELTGVFGTVQRRWSDISRILLDSSGAAAAPVPIAGLWARVTLQPPIDHPAAEEACALAIQSVADGHLAGRHEILGDVRLPLSAVRRIEPRFLGTRIMLSRDAQHLGDETRADFPQPVPEGHTLSGEWTLEAVPPGRAFFGVDVADLEPSGPDAPLGTPFLRDLRDGFLRTDVVVNGQRLGSLNELLRWKPPLEQPQRVRLPVPAGVVREGRNVWKIEQYPARANPREFDDALVGPIAIEFDEGP